MHPGQDQEARIIDDEMKVFLALLMAPTDKALTRCALPGGGTKAKQGDGLVPGIDEVAQLRAGQRRVTKIVVAFDILIPQA